MASLFNIRDIGPDDYIVVTAPKDDNDPYYFNIPLSTYIMGHLFFFTFMYFRMYPDYIKLKAILHYQFIQRSIRKVSSIYNIGKSTLCRWLQRG